MVAREVRTPIFQDPLQPPLGQIRADHVFGEECEGKEVVYQAVPYVGMAKAIDLICVSNEVFEERGIPLPLPGQSTTTPGARLQEGVRGSESDYRR